MVWGVRGTGFPRVGLPVIGPAVVIQVPLAGLSEGEVGSELVLGERFAGYGVDGLGVDCCDDGRALVRPARLGL